MEPGRDQTVGVPTQQRHFECRRSHLEPFQSKPALVGFVFVHSFIHSLFECGVYCARRWGAAWGRADEVCSTGAQSTGERTAPPSDTHMTGLSPANTHGVCDVGLEQGSLPWGREGKTLRKWPLKDEPQGTRGKASRAEGHCSCRDSRVGSQSTGHSGSEVAVESQPGKPSMLSIGGLYPKSDGESL